VHHPSPTPDGSFFLLAVFRRYLFRLTEDSVAMALHCCLGGSPAGLHVVFESDRHFRFSVSNKQVGFLIQSLKRITTEQFDVYFHLWHDGGANWVKEKNQVAERRREQLDHPDKSQEQAEFCSQEGFISSQAHPRLTNHKISAKRAQLGNQDW
jgi:hypothetical protein